MTSKKTIELEKIVTTLIEKGVIENRIKEGVFIEKEDILELKKANLKLAEGERYVVLVVSGHLASISKEARELSASKEFAVQAIAKALVVEYLGHKIVGNFYLKINKPAMKTKLFSNREDALIWLRKKLSKDKKDKESRNASLLF